MPKVNILPGTEKIWIETLPIHLSKGKMMTPDDDGQEAGAGG